MTNSAIQVESLSKRYRIGVQEARPESLVQALTGWAKAPIRNFRRLHGRTHFDQNGHDDGSDTIWALRDVSFEVQQGETLGIIGRNGAGKSTLLKILSRITEPTSGRAVINGRVASLLEVGTGFHPELTGRENVYLNATILGMRKSEVDRKFDEIVGFSGVEKFIDTPVKFYSSGMKVRLAFSVAAHLEPEILIIDEVLAVGDAEFQKKCLGKMEDVASNGRTVIFVSHNMGAVRDLTRQCMYLVGGLLTNYGNTPEVIDQYMKQGLANRDAKSANLQFFRRDDDPNAYARFNQIWVNNATSDIADVPVGQPLTIHMDVEAYRPITGAAMAISLKRMTGEVISTILTADCGYKIDLLPGNTTITCRVDDIFLFPGTYLINVGINQAVGTKAWDAILDYPAFRIVNIGERALVNRPERPGLVYSRNAYWQTSLCQKEQEK
jgi:lipopolysaccharide transport system ATP-binding protein